MIHAMAAPLVVQFADRQGHFRTALICKLGRKYAQLIWIDSSVSGQGIRVHRAPLRSVLRYSRPIEPAYPPKKAARVRYLGSRKALANYSKRWARYGY